MQRRDYIREQAITTATATKTSVENGVRAASNFITRFPSRSIREMLANFSGVEF